MTRSRSCSTSSASSGTAPTPTTPTLDPIEFEAAIAAGSPERDFGERSDDDVYLLYTGGTTGMPKGVMWRQEDVYFALGGGIDVFTNERVTSPDDGEREDRPVAAQRVCVDHADPAAHARRRPVLDLPRRPVEGNTAVIVDKFDAEEMWRTRREARAST